MKNKTSCILRTREFRRPGRNVYILFFFFFVIYLDGAGQSPWVPEKNNYFFQFSYITIPEYSSLFFSEGEDFQTSREVVDNTLQLYGEYGVGLGFSLLASVPYKILKTGDLNPLYTGDPEPIPDAASANALGNVDLGIKYRILRNNWAMGVQFNVELPANEGDAEITGLYPGYDALAVAPLVSIGKGWSRFYFFGFASSQFRSNDFDDKLDVGIEGGWKPVRPLWLIPYVGWVKSFNNGTKTPWPVEKQFGLYSPRLEYTAFGLKLIYEIDLSDSHHLGIIAHAAGSFSGNLVAQSPLLNLGVFIKKE